MSTGIEWLDRLDALITKHRTEVEEIVNALTQLGDEANIPRGNNLELHLTSQYLRRLKRIDEFDVDLLDEEDSDSSDADEDEDEEEEKEDEDEEEEDEDEEDAA
jgi:hypothetical protein